MAKLPKKKVIQQICGDPLAVHGFQPDSEKSIFGGSAFSRQTAKGADYIRFESSRWDPNTLRVTFFTEKQKFPLPDRLLVPGREEIPWHEYSDEASLQQTVSELLDVILHRGLKWFETPISPLSPNWPNFIRSL
jgi:hypothetical protein